ncbi:P-loop NTPase fold protein [Shewanella sp. JL219SE-S6]
MKIVTPEVQIDDETGFEPSIDIFERKEFGERLANLIENAESNPVIALDAGWGQGKSTFIKMWRGYLSHQREKKFSQCISMPSKMIIKRTHFWRWHLRCIN